MKPIKIRDKIHHDRIYNIKQSVKNSFKVPTYNSNLQNLRTYLGTSIFFLPANMENLQRMYNLYLSLSSFDYILSFSKFKERHPTKQGKFNRNIMIKNSIKDKSSKAFLATIKDQVR